MKGIMTQTVRSVYEKLAVSKWKSASRYESAAMQTTETVVKVPEAEPVTKPKEKKGWA